MTVNAYCMIDKIIQQQTVGSLNPYRVAQQSCQDVKRHKSIDVLIPHMGFCLTTYEL